jgi:hypothetical protein
MVFRFFVGKLTMRTFLLSAEGLPGQKVARRVHQGFAAGQGWGLEAYFSVYGRTWSLLFHRGVNCYPLHVLFP